jgi:MoaA/NifB/PqqE/SkfB family radical SAM enzyme
MKYFSDHSNSQNFRINRHLAAFKKLTPIRAFNLAVLLGELKLRRPILKSHPIFMRINPYNGCNLSCPGCFIGAEKTGLITRKIKRGRSLSLDNYKICVDKLSKYLLKIVLYDEGEPLLNNDLINMISYASSKNISTVVSTNFSLELPDDYFRQLVLSGLEHIIIALDGITQDIYEQYRVGGDVELVINNVNMLVETKKEMNRTNPLIEIQFIKFGYNNHQLNDVKNLSEKLPVDVFTSFSSSAVLNDISKLKSKGAGQAKKRVNDGCLDLWATADIDTDGSLYSCDMGEDYGAPKIGSLTESEFKMLWNHPNMVELRKSFSNNSLKPAYNYCEVCPSSQGLPNFLK